MKKAFTLVELMLSVALMAVIAVGVNTYFISSLRSARKSATDAIVKSEGEQIQANIVQAVKFAKRINGCPPAPTPPAYSSLSLLASDGSDIDFSLNGTILTQRIVPPNPTPIIMIPLNSTKTNMVPCAGTIFTCTTGGKTVELCFVLSSAGAGDVTDATSMTFRNYIYSSN